MWASMALAARRQWRPMRKDGKPDGHLARNGAPTPVTHTDPDQTRPGPDLPLADSDGDEDDGRCRPAPHAIRGPANGNNHDSYPWDLGTNVDGGGALAGGDNHDIVAAESDSELTLGHVPEDAMLTLGHVPEDAMLTLGHVPVDAMLTLGHVSEKFSGLGGAMYKASTLYDLSLAPGLWDNEEDNVDGLMTPWTPIPSSPPKVTSDDSVSTDPRWEPYLDPTCAPEDGPTWAWEQGPTWALENGPSDTVGLPSLCTDYKRARTRDFWADDDQDYVGGGEGWDEETYIWEEGEEQQDGQWWPPPWSCHGPCPGKRPVEEYRYFTPGHLDVIAEDDELATAPAADIDICGSSISSRSGSSSKVGGSEEDTMEGQDATVIAQKNGLTNGDLNHSPPPDGVLRKKQKVIYMEGNVNGGHFINQDEEAGRLLEETDLENWCSVRSSAEGPGNDYSAKNGPLGTKYNVRKYNVTDDDDVIDEEVAASNGEVCIHEVLSQPDGDLQGEKTSGKTGELINMDDLDKMVLSLDAKPVTVTETVTVTTTEYLANGQTRKRTEIIKTTKTVEPISTEDAPRLEETSTPETRPPTEHPERVAEEQLHPVTMETVTCEPSTVMVEEEPPVIVTPEPEIVTTQTSQLISTEPPQEWADVEHVPSPDVEPVAVTRSAVSELETKEHPKPITVNITVEASVQSPSAFEDALTSQTDVPPSQTTGPVHYQSPYPYNALLLDSDVIADLVYTRFRPTVDKKKIIILLFPPPYQNLEPLEVKPEVLQPLQTSVETALPPPEENVTAEPEEKTVDVEVTSDAEEVEPKTSRKKGNIFRRMVRAVRRAFNRG